MKILIFTNQANGFYLFRKELLLALLKKGHQVVISVPPDEKVALLEGLSAKALQVIPTPFERRGMNPLRDFGLFLTYLRILRKENPDRVLTYTIKPNLYGGLACRILRVPYFCTVTGLGTAIENGGPLRGALLFFYRVATKKARLVFFQNGRNLAFMAEHGIAKGNSLLVPGSGVNLSEHPFVPYPPENPIRFLAVLRIMKDKGVGEYLEAVRIVKKRHPQVSFLLAGEYEEETRASYEPAVKALEKERTLEYLGQIDNVPQVMAGCHVIVHPSYHEGLSNVLLEAASCGRPVLASRIPGCVETFVEGESGLSFAARDTDALVKAMEKILTLSAARRREMGEAGRAFVEKNFDRQKVVEAYLEAIA